MRSRIIEASTSLFHANGVKEVTMDDISRSLKISKRTLYEYFSSKEEVIGECIAYRIEQERGLLTTSGMLLDDLVNGYRSLSQTELSVSRRCCKGLQKYYTESFECILAYIQEYAASCTAKVAEAKDAGYIRREVSPEFVRASIAQYLVNRITPHSLAFRSDEATAYTILVFARGIATIKGRAHIDNLLKGVK